MISRLISLLLAMTPVPLWADAADRARLGESALAAGLWEIAASHFEAALADPGLSAQDKALFGIRLAEAWLRDGRAAEALKLLEDPGPADHPEMPFWKAQALAASGAHAEAAETLALLAKNPLAPYHAEAVVTLANLQQAMGENTAALASLKQLEETGDPALAAKARLRQVEILLDLDRLEEARATLPGVAEVSTGDQPRQAYLEASLLLKERRPNEAAMIFRGLLDQPRNQSLRRHHLAAVGHAKALLAMGDKEAASSFILSFLQSHPESPELDALFHLFREAFPENPAAGEPLFDALDTWTTPADPPATGPLAVAGAHAAAAWPSAPHGADITAHALFTRALLLRRTNAPDVGIRIRRIFNRLRVEFAAHPLAARALYEFAGMQAEDGNIDRAMGILEGLRRMETDARLLGHAAFLQASIAQAAGDRDLAAQLFGEASQHLVGDQAQAALFNSAILILTDDEAESPAAPEDPELAAEIRLERALAREDAAGRIAALDEFLIANPDHPRMAEARLALAEAALAILPPDLSLARAQLDTMAADPENPNDADDPRTTMVRLAIADLAGDSEAAVTLARGVIERFPGTPPAAEAALMLGRNLYRSEAYNEARMVFEQVAADETDPGRAEAALLLAARSAALIPASQSQQEALVLFRRVIDGEGPLASIATIEMARLMIDMNRLDEAAQFLRGWFGTMEENDPLRLPAGLLLGEAVYAMGAGNPDSLGEALAVYDTLLAGAEKHGGLFNRLQYLRGRALEQMPNEREAFSAYYSVLETDEAPAEWHYFELCGFRALALLEKAGRWPAAIACARKIASFNGPRAEEAANRASQLQLKHMIWED